MKGTKGFSLIELLIVVAIILIIAAIAIPNLLQARLSANEASAAGSLSAIKTSEIAYYTAYPTIGYAPDIGSLGGASPCAPSSTTACLLDSFLSASTPGSTGKSGYYYLATGISSCWRDHQCGFRSSQRPDVDAFHREPRLLLDQRWRTAFANGERGRPSGEQPGVVPGVPGGTVANFLASRSHVRLRLGSQNPTSRIRTHN